MFLLKNVTDKSLLFSADCSIFQLSSRAVEVFPGQSGWALYRVGVPMKVRFHLKYASLHKLHLL